MPPVLWISIGILFLTVNPVFASQSVTVQMDEWQATYSHPTNRYGHAVLGNTPEWSRLCIKGPDAKACTTLPKNKIFEDISPRLADVDLDGRLDAVVVEADNRLGASLVVYQLNSDGSLRRTSNPPIGTSYRWLAPIGISDLDGDGKVEIAYIDRPHLARTLRIWRFVDYELVEVAEKRGLSNHRIGDAFIVGGLRQCHGKPPELITADASWTNVVATRYDGKSLISRNVRPLANQADFEIALECD